MWRTRFDQRGVWLPPAARQLLREGMLVGLVCVCVCVPVPTGHRHTSQTCQEPSAGQCGALRRETIYSTIQFNSLNSQMKLYLSVLTHSGKHDLFQLNLDIRSFDFWNGNTVRVYALSRQTDRKTCGILFFDGVVLRKVKTQTFILLSDLPSPNFKIRPFTQKLCMPLCELTRQTFIISDICLEWRVYFSVYHAGVWEVCHSHTLRRTF